VGRADEYRRRAQQCLEMAGTFRERKARIALSYMADAWLRLADRYQDDNEIRPTFQQQQQLQPRIAERAREPTATYSTKLCDRQRRSGQPEIFHDGSLSRVAPAWLGFSADPVVGYSFGPEGTRQTMTKNVEFRIMPNGEHGHWYWEVIKDGREVIARGITDTEPVACAQAHEAAQKAGLAE